MTRGSSYGPIRMIALAEPLDHRIDLDRVDALGAPLQRAADVVARSGADDQHLAERLAAGVAIEQVRQRVGGKRRARAAASAGGRSG